MKFYQYFEKKIVCFCIDVYKENEDGDFNEVFIILWKLKNNRLKIKKYLVEKYKNMDEELEKNHYSRTAKGINRFEHDTI